MKKKHCTVFIVLVLVVGFGMMLFSAPVISTTERVLDRQYYEAAIVWSDNFTDGNMDGWDTFTYPLSEHPANFTIIDGVVYAYGDESTIIAVHESTVAYGTWSYDMFFGENPDTGVEFISSGSLVESNDRGYELISDASSIHLDKLSVNSNSEFVYKALGTHFMNPAAWYHVDITRDSKGYFCVYLNRTLVIEAVDKTMTTSNQLSFGFVRNGGAFDNVMVNNTVDIDLVGPRFIDAPTDQTVNEGERFQYIINATDVHWIDQNSWTVNDTEHFAVSSAGIITNATTLEAGVYGLEVSVSDSWDNTRSATFSVTVLSVAVPYDPILLIVGGGAAAVVIIVAIVMYMKKKP